MAASLVGGAALGPVFGLLLKAVVNAGVSIATFRSKLSRLRQTLIEIQPVFDDIERLNKALEGRDEVKEMFKKWLIKGEELVRKCSETKRYNVLNKLIYSRKLTELENSLVKLCQIHGLIDVVRDNKLTLAKVSENGKKLDEIHSMMRNVSLRDSRSSIGFTNSSASSGWMTGSSFGSSNGFSGWYDVPQVPDSMVGFEVSLEELKLKLKLLQEKDQVLVLSAPPACRKTTLAAKLWQEDDIKGGEKLWRFSAGS